MKTNLKITATKELVNNAALTDKNAIRLSLKSNGNAGAILYPFLQEKCTLFINNSLNSLNN